MIKEYIKLFSWESAKNKYNSVYKICENAEQEKGPDDSYKNVLERYDSLGN